MLNEGKNMQTKQPNMLLHQFGFQPRPSICSFRMDKVVAFEIANTFTGRGTKMSVAPGVIRPQLGCTVKITEKTGVR